mmetsp:Transcript_20762/g.31709  ORF Transcript_20762/g.31709 Transcript_20762/m.31709 type:complete len:88 (-) Transcript_20762:795-1058(-)
MQIQQNSCRHCLHVMWLQPWFFSMREEHFGQALVFANIQLAVSDSSLHFSFQRINSLQEIGACGSSPHERQKDESQSMHLATPDKYM